MRKRIVKSRKKIKKTSGAAKKARTEGRPRGRKNRPSPSGGALVVYERGEMERSAWDCEDNGAEEKKDTPDVPTEPNAVAPDDRRGDILRIVCGFVVIFSLFSAAVLTCFSFAIAADSSDDGSVDADADVWEDSETEGGKIVFVHPSYDGSDALSAPELYEKCAKSAVSVLVELSSEVGGGKGIGSGFVLSEDGYIATAAHVISGAEEITVILYDGQEYKAEIAAKDSLSDIALLKIEAAGLPAVTFGASGGLLAGERIYAIGTPASLDYAGTLSSGEISCPERLVSVYGEGVMTVEKKLRLIQINADVNKGNSGCPLFDEYGKVVGMVTMKLGSEYSGIGFAIPSDGLAVVLEAMLGGKELNSDILSGVAVLPPKLGISGSVDELGGVYGYRIESITGNGSGAASALKVGDLVVQIDKRIITKASDITEAIEKKNSGDTVKVTVLRSGQRLTFDIVLGG